ncbi:MarR family winged helix-turn-helix transcriptional regulator [Streptomyces sp. NPDC001530]|uniref:MarR family winged helix-turn-helix transcriptional regulator n=1 Tax=Streptomyces sp. NPDC001530 TaxID=3364582 RepID=UPI003684F2A2
MTAEQPPAPLESRLGYLLKHAQQRLARASAGALAPLGIDGHELAVLALFSAEYPLSQVEAAGRLGVDRTTMVALVDGLEDHGLVERRRSPQDRRKNIVELTAAGRDCLRRAERARRDMERRFLAPLDEEAAATLVRSLQLLAAEDRVTE